MIRVLLVVLATAGVVSAIDVAPLPREIRADGSRDPVPEPTPIKKEDPREVVERIIKNSNAVGDKLAMTDAGAETQKTQGTILKDIDALLKREEDPPPMSDKNMDKSKDMQNMSDPHEKKKDDMMPMGGMDPKDSPDKHPDKKDMGKGMDQQPMGGSQPKGHRPRPQQGDQQPKGPGMNQATGDPKPMSGMPAQQPPKAPGGQLPDPTGDPKSPGKPALPFEEQMVKDVWGHLPDKLRQQASQYYKHEFMPRYAELLKLYYSSLSEKDKR